MADTKICTYKKRMVCTGLCFFLSLLSLAMMPVTLIVLMPKTFYSAWMKMSMTDTFDKFNFTAGVAGSLEFTHCFFNLTNGHALLTAAPPKPKPAFEEVCVKVISKTQNFDYEPSNDASEYTYKTWAQLDLVNEYDWDLQLARAQGCARSAKRIPRVRKPLRVCTPGRGGGGDVRAHRFKRSRGSRPWPHTSERPLTLRTRPVLHFCSGTPLPAAHNRPSHNPSPYTR